MMMTMEAVATLVLASTFVFGALALCFNGLCGCCGGGAESDLESGQGAEQGTELIEKQPGAAAQAPEQAQMVEARKPPATVTLVPPAAPSPEDRRSWQSQQAKERMSQRASHQKQRMEAMTEEDVDWFHRIFGFQEMTGDTEEYEKTQQEFTYDRSTGVLVCKGKEFKAGHFDTPRLDALRQQFEEKKEQIMEVLGGKLSLTEDVGDVSAMHTREENRFALFQVASQFNALEHVSQEDIPEYGITCYSDDITQGPACATACAAGTVVRNYFAFPDGGQTQERQVRNLGEVEEVLDNKTHNYFEVQSGYTMSTDESLEKLGAVMKDAELRETLKTKLHIGVQQDTEVVSCRFGAEDYDGPPGVQLVTQCYCSAISVSYSECDPDLWEPFAWMILEAAYEMTLYVAVENAMRHQGMHGSRKVFLTALGGGVFGNDMAWIEDSMGKAFDKFKDLGLEIIMVSYGHSTPEFQRLADRFVGA